jgi:uncharacterized membrane protein
MSRLIELHPEQLVLWIAALAVLLVVGRYVIGKIRAAAIQQEPKAAEMLTKFRELHSRGVLSDAEFRTIKTTLAVELQEELKGKDETG